MAPSVRGGDCPPHPGGSEDPAGGAGNVRCLVLAPGRCRCLLLGAQQAPLGPVAPWWPGLSPALPLCVPEPSGMGWRPGPGGKAPRVPFPSSWSHSLWVTPAPCPDAAPPPPVPCVASEAASRPSMRQQLHAMASWLCLGTFSLVGLYTHVCGQRPVGKRRVFEWNEYVTGRPAPLTL